jgi:hypothetical protein
MLHVCSRDTDIWRLLIRFVLFFESFRELAFWAATMQSLLPL